MENSSNRKRSREASSSGDSKPLDSKRLRRPDRFIGIIDDDDVGGSGTDYLADVMRNLEDEISLSSPHPRHPPPPQHGLGYLLEASDDELGLPPAVGSDTPSSYRGDAAEEPEGFGRIWGYEDDISVAYGSSVDFGLGDDISVVEDIGFGFDYGLFDYSDVGSVPSNNEEFLWRMDETRRTSKGTEYFW